ncbi:hypothetical protein [Nostoc sp.]|uniref:hypothetical protein n=1 Tax=Nostoc sp. TaxID=1180 RepID=UPI002FF6D795
MVRLRSPAAQGIALRVACFFAGVCGSLRQAASLREAAPTRLRSSYSLAHLHTELVLPVFYKFMTN